MAKASLYRMTNDQAREMLEGIRWPNGPICPHCGSDNVAALNGKTCRPGLKKCRVCRKQFTVTVGTIFERSHIGLGEWVYAFASMCASKKGISALQLKRELEVSYETAWFMCHRIREAMRTEGEPLWGTIEADETYVGGKPRKKQGDTTQLKRGRGTRKTPVVALVERGGNVRTRVVVDVTAKTLRETIEMYCDPAGSMLITDEWPCYTAVGKTFAKGHAVVNHHSGQYSDGNGVTTNTVEGFFALIKRGVYGNFHSISKKHLQRYCHEFEFRWNNRYLNDTQKTVEALRQSSGKRLMYKGSASVTGV